MRLNQRQEGSKSFEGGVWRVSQAEGASVELQPQTQVRAPAGQVRAAREKFKVRARGGQDRQLEAM